MPENLEQGIQELVVLNRVLAREGILDAYGHVSIRHPGNRERFLLSRARSPECVGRDDILEFALDGSPAVPDAPAPLYIERFIHAALYAQRPDVSAVCHSHTSSILPFSVSSTTRLVPTINASRMFGTGVAVWDIADEFGPETDMLVRTMEHAKSLADAIGEASLALMRGHGSVVVATNPRDIVSACLAMDRGAKAQLSARELGSTRSFTDAELAPHSGLPGALRADDRAWEYFLKRASLSEDEQGDHDGSRVRLVEGGGRGKPIADVRRQELVSANRILGHEGILDAFGHVSVRHPDNPDRFLLSRARAPEMVEDEDILEFDLMGEPTTRGGPAPYIERYIHAAVYAARPDVGSVCHSHTPSILPFSVSTTPLRAVIHAARFLGTEVPVWDLAREFPGEWSPLVRSLEYGESLAARLGTGSIALLRGHGSVVAARDVQEIVNHCIAMDRNAVVQEVAVRLGDYVPLHDGECQAAENLAGARENRAWEYFCRRAGLQ
jgi:HCOMODA/2-hydroxy-3-carboxy-muconic semialdehyde decarboxylase